MLPDGIVTFVFTDIEGSTALFHELGDDYLAVLAQHHAALRRVWATHGGIELGTEGDAFFVAFADAAAAMRAGADAQRVLAETDWPHGRPVRVRIGMHTGSAVIVEGKDYVGLDVHQAARVAGAAHGGQVLLTGSTLDAAGLQSDDELGVHDLGSHRLKDFPTARRLLQLTGPGLENTFPPPRTSTARSHNLPRPTSAIVGRSGELEAVQRTVVGDARLVTLTGAGGLGKTRLALEVGWSVLGWFREGVWFVDLAGLTESAAIPGAMMSAIGLLERTGATPQQQLVEQLGNGPSLLVLDNLEQLLSDDGITVVSDLLAACPELTVLATSRERLRLRGEHEIVLDGLDTADAVALFTARALAADAHFASDLVQVEKLSAELGGIPLALELAAARVRTHDVDQLLVELTDALDLLSEGDRDLPARHRTMRATVAWSWRLCDDEERTVLRSVAVFGGNAEAAAIGAVHGAPVDRVLEQLADCSFIVRRGDRFGVLVPIRAFLGEQLTSDVRAALESRHGHHFADLAATASPHLVSAEQARWLDRLDAETTDLELAVRRLPPAKALEMAGALVRWWVRHSRWTAGRQSLAEALSRAEPSVDPTILARALAGAAELAVAQGELSEAETHLARAAALPADLAVQAHVAILQGLAARTAGELDAAGLAYARAKSLAEEAGQPRLAAIALLNTGDAAFKRASAAMTRDQAITEDTQLWLDRARQAMSESRQKALPTGDDHLILQITLDLAGVESYFDAHSARKVMQTARDLADRLGNLETRAHADANLGMMALRENDVQEAGDRFSSALQTAEEVGSLAQQGTVLYLWSLDDSDLPASIARARRSIALAERLGNPIELEQRQAVLAELLKRHAQAPSA